MTLPILPYNGSSGWSGSETSHERAEDLDASGRTQRLQAFALKYLAVAKSYGATAPEFGRAAVEPHQTYSSVMSNLHKAGLIVRLKQRRARSAVYVLPDYVLGRPTSAHRPNVAARKLVEIEALVANREYLGSSVVWVADLRRILGPTKES